MALLNVCSKDNCPSPSWYAQELQSAAEDEDADVRPRLPSITARLQAAAAARAELVQKEKAQQQEREAALAQAALDDPNEIELE